MVEDDSLDVPRRRSADLALHPVQQHPRLPLDGLQVGHWQERAGPKEGHTLAYEHSRKVECPNVEG